MVFLNFYILKFSVGIYGNEVTADT